MATVSAFSPGTRSGWGSCSSCYSRVDLFYHSRYVVAAFDVLLCTYCPSRGAICENDVSRTLLTAWLTAGVHCHLIFHRGRFMHWISLPVGSSWLRGPPIAECSCGTLVTDSWWASWKDTPIPSTPWSSVEMERSLPLVCDHCLIQFEIVRLSRVQ